MRSRLTPMPIGRPPSCSARRTPPETARLRHLAAPGEGAAERDLVGVLEVAAHREAAGEPRHADAATEAVGEVGGGRLARHVRVRREDDLLDAVPVDAVEELVDA